MLLVPDAARRLVVEARRCRESPSSSQWRVRNTPSAAADPNPFFTCHASSARVNWPKPPSSTFPALCAASFDRGDECENDSRSTDVVDACRISLSKTMRETACRNFALMCWCGVTRDDALGNLTRHGLCTRRRRTASRTRTRERTRSVDIRRVAEHLRSSPGLTPPSSAISPSRSTLARSMSSTCRPVASPSAVP